MTAPLSANPNPISFDAGPLGKVYVTGQFSALGLVQSNHVPGDDSALGDISNGQVEIQTTSGPVQFFIEAGAYSLPSLGTGYLKAGHNTSETFGALPVAYAKFVLTPEISIQVGSLPTLIGAEYTFSFQNMNIERGLLWNQEPAISKGVQANYAKGPLTVSVSVNDGYYSDHYNWVSGLTSFVIDPANTIAVAAGGNFASTVTNKFVAPYNQSNSSIFNLIYTYSAGPLTINPYFQYTHVSENDNIGILRSASTYSGAVLAKYNFTPEFSVAGRAEYIDSTGSTCGAGGPFCFPTNLLYGPRSNAFSFTVTPTYQKGIFFARGEISYTRIGSLEPGFGFGGNYDSKDQVRGLLETGFLF